MAQPDIDRLRLIRSHRIGPVSYRQLIQRFGSAGEALKALPDLAARGGGKFVAADLRQIEAEVVQAGKAGARYLFLDSPEYPDLLAELDNAPAAFTYRGDLAVLGRVSVAIVGARNASAGACKFARTLAMELASQSIVVVSGLARGIDTASHIGALKGGTIAVVAGGIDVTYPPENAELQEKIAQDGLLIAEQPPGTEPHARHFPFRNRIIAGLAQGTLVVEAAPKSGSLITARLAAEAGRQVMAIPGSPIDPRARGCNQLIREGAVLVQDASEIAELLMPFDNRMTSSGKPNAFYDERVPTDAEDSDRETVTGLLSHSYVGVDEIVRQSGVASPTVQLVLLELELAGRLERGAGAKVRLTS